MPGTFWSETSAWDLASPSWKLVWCLQDVKGEVTKEALEKDPEMVALLQAVDDAHGVLKSSVDSLLGKLDKFAVEGELSKGQARPYDRGGR